MLIWYNDQDMLTSGNIFSHEKRFFLHGICERVGHYIGGSCIGGSCEKRGGSQGTSSYVYGGYDDGRRVYHRFRCFRFSFCQSQCRLARPAYVACRSRLFSIISMLYVAEATLRTTRPLQLSGLAEKYVGKIGSWLIFFSVGATSFCSLIAYTSGCGKILSEFFGISLEMASCLFALGATSVVWLGLKATGVAEKYLSSGMTAMLILLVGASLFSARVPVADILYTHWMYAVPVFNIAVFCYAVQYIVPEISRGFTHEPGNSSRPSWPGPAFPSSSWLWSRWPSFSCCPSMKFRKSRPYPGAAPWGRRSSSSSSMPLPSAPC